MRHFYFTMTFIAFFPIASWAETFITCKPSETRQWPHNAHVEISVSGKNMTMKVSSSFYGVTFEDIEAVEKRATETEIIFQSRKFRLTIDLTKKDRNSNAILENSEEGNQELICK